MEKVAAVLNDIKEKASAQAALLTSEVGLVVGGVAEDDVDLEVFAAYSASYASMAWRMNKETHFGPLDSVIVSYRGRAVVIAPVDDSIVAAVVGSEGAQLGTIRLQLRRSLDALRSALQGEVQEALPTLDDLTDQALVQTPNGATAPVPEDASLKLG